jgi:hypothetical protein
MRATCLLTILLFALSGCGNDDNGVDDNTEALVYIGLAVGNYWEFDVDVGVAIPLLGEVEVVSIDKEYPAGTRSPPRGYSCWGKRSRNRAPWWSVLLTTPSR